jgi:hypothetical protein
MVLIILWHIWKARNAMIFNADDIVVVGVLRLIAKYINLWACRYKGRKEPHSCLERLRSKLV